VSRELALHVAAAPAAVVDLLRFHRAVGALGAESDDMARELAQQIAAGNPRRQRKILDRLGVRDPTLHLEVMPRDIRHLQAIANQKGLPPVTENEDCAALAASRILSQSARGAALAIRASTPYRASQMVPFGVKRERS
jgi:hypothetical protein